MALRPCQCAGVGCDAWRSRTPGRLGQCEDANDQPGTEHRRCGDAQQRRGRGGIAACHLPQCAAEADLHAFTDDGALAEWAGLAVVVFEGDPRNRKITQPADLIEAADKLPR